MIAICETRCQYHGILDRLTPALPQIWRHRVRRIPEKGYAILTPAL
jgi:hypothetical protein